MSWSYPRARSRVALNAQDMQVRVERFREDYLPRVIAQTQGRTLGASPSPRIRDLEPGVAVVVNTVQIYIQVANYDDMRLDNGQETEASHARALSFLHLHYASLDRAADAVEAQRVDFHGPRMHAVILQPASDDDNAMRVSVQQAMQLATRTIALAQAATRDIARSNVRPLFRVGIDIGTCVAIDSGRDDEREPLFIGGAANYAAKLAEGTEPGVYPSDRVRALLGLKAMGGLPEERAMNLSEAEVSRFGGEALDESVTEDDVVKLRDTLRKHRDATVGKEGFVFHAHTPPLKTLKYADLCPSYSVRMPLVSIFADLDGYTAYVDSAVKSGKVQEAVRDLQVIRAELNAVLQDDFEGRKVRFVGDCIHGLLAAGDRSADEALTVESATACVGALRSSFGVCQEMLPTTQHLGLAIGYELGVTPVSRIGIRGERAVRVASSAATLDAEAHQSVCTGTETMIGERAYDWASRDTQRLFDKRRISADLDYDTVVMQSAPAKLASGGSVEGVTDNRSHSI